LTLLLLYAYCVDTFPSRKIERACYEDLAFRALTQAWFKVSAWAWFWLSVRYR
jgi:hypothetical protein